MGHIGLEPAVLSTIASFTMPTTVTTTDRSLGVLEPATIVKLPRRPRSLHAADKHTQQRLRQIAYADDGRLDKAQWPSATTRRHRLDLMSGTNGEPILVLQKRRPGKTDMSSRILDATTRGHHFQLAYDTESQRYELRPLQRSVSDDTPARSLRVTPGAVPTSRTFQGLVASLAKAVGVQHWQYDQAVARASKTQKSPRGLSVDA